ncbi:MAG: cellulose synthase complex periplasmic endoglucanase BcsZ [Acidobacteriota bacterium]
MVFGGFRLGKRSLLLLPLFLTLCASGGCKDTSWPLWQSYSNRFVDSQGRVFDPQGDQRTTSEGESYALFFSLVANNRASFDRVLAWTQANLAQDDLGQHLPAWLWGRSSDGQWKVLDPNSASDADVWIAYSLIEAGRLWKFKPYEALGRAMMAQIARTEVANLPGFGPMLLPGPVGFQHGQNWTLNPSYLPLFIFDRFADVDPAGPWRQIAVRIPTLLEESARHGYAMDWVQYVPGDGFYPTTEQTPDHDQKTDQPGGSYDAIRVYLWAGMLAPGTPGRRHLLNAIPAMGAYLGQHPLPPEKVGEDGIPVSQNGPVGFSAALLPYLHALPGMSRVSAEQMIRLAREKDPGTGLYGKSPAYYDQNLALFGTGFLDRRFRFGTSGELNVEWKLR